MNFKSIECITDIPKPRPHIKYLTQHWFCFQTLDEANEKMCNHIKPAK